ncbi:polysaccharide biosynthesis/export family protein [Acanthopleuribacter pedis]|uniref:Polysaccharide export protein n=1 Tax=Acanthopleuribacter pedis TaxID=442870 RepID=A0A8J7QCI2_9BACT|nr:polysaccharide biosynthesis/export family protein [Acanthopleuribacter pedis]MBO1317030.1 polysaccharide export protein [Acanthopleuribacter pedis]
MKWFATALLLVSTATLIAQEYIIGPGDLIKIFEMNYPQIEGEYRVNSLGYISLPELGRIKVKGLSIAETQEAVSNQMQKYLNNPQVLVEVSEYNYRPISVLGAVHRPGRLEGYSPNLTLVNALSQAGGVGENASDKVIVMRQTEAGLTETLEISYERLMFHAQAHLNIPLFPGDTVNIPVEKPFRVSIIGEVNKPGEMEFSRGGKVTILRVIAAAGGLTDYARRRGVLVKRQVGGKDQEFKVDIRAITNGSEQDFEMNHGDVVIVP